MKIVLASPSAGKCGVNTLLDEKYPNVPISFAYGQSIDSWSYTPDFFILDSGAFTAWSVGKSVDLRAYGEFAVKQTSRWKHTISVNLDVIPGVKGRTSTEKERNAAVSMSLKNADYLRTLGLRIMEVYHQDEPIEVLEHLISRRRPGEILGVSPRNDVSMKRKQSWLKSLMPIILRHCDKTSFIPCHGLGAVSETLMTSFPFYSVDCSSWLVPQRWGYARIRNKGHVRLDALVSKDKTRLTFKTKEHVSLMAYGTREHIRSYQHLQDQMTIFWKKNGLRYAL